MTKFRVFFRGLFRCFWIPIKIIGISVLIVIFLITFFPAILVSLLLMFANEEKLANRILRFYKIYED